MNAERNVEVARRIFAAHNKGSEAFLAEYEEHFHPDCEWVPAIVGGLEGTSYRGRDGFRRWYAERDDALEESAVNVTSCTPVSESVVLVLGRSLTRGRSSGAKVDEEVGIVLRFREGRIEHDQAYASHREASEAAQQHA